MPFWKKEKDNGKSKEKVNYKSRLEHKQYLAQESPEPIYDLVDCGLKALPAGVFSKCKVLRKEALLVQDNELSSLSNGSGSSLSQLGELHVLDIHNNCIEKLPEDIDALKTLKALYLQNNRIKQLPSNIGNLKNLQTLNISGNNLKDLPPSISGLTCLKTLDLSKNPKLTKLPKDIGHLHSLENLLLDTDVVTYPKKDITTAGTEAIMRFFCSELGVDYVSPENHVAEKQHQNGSVNGKDIKQLIDPYDELIKNHLQKEEKIKEDKKQQALVLEKRMMETQERESELQRLNDENKKKLLDNLAEEESKKEAEIVKLQKARDIERKVLNDRMSCAEKQSDFLIKELMESNQRFSDPSAVMQALEEDKKKLEKQFTILKGDAEKLREKDILLSMQLMMEEEMQKKATIEAYKNRQCVIQSALTSTLESDKAVESVLASKGREKTELISKMLEDEKYQREAFQALLLQQDDRALEIGEQMARIQNELASLTFVEMKKRDMKVEFEMELMSEKRETLTKLLLDLMQRKQQRADDLQRMMQEMEEGKEKEQENYWLIQYQKLLDSKPKGLENAEKKLDSKVKEILTSCGGEEFIPLFAKKELTFKEVQYMEDKDLRELGISSEYMRNKIRVCIEEYVAMDERIGAKLNKINYSNGDGAPSAPASNLDDSNPSAPSLPPENDETSPPPSAPAMIQTFHTPECVVCLERKSCVIMLPCGHLCSCSECSFDLTHCPLCRSAIITRVNI